MTPITPVLLCGGSGTRLWPLSRKAMPKQFARLIGEDTLYQAALRRLSGPGWSAPVVVTAGAYLGMARDQALEAGVAPTCLMVEPSPRNTAPAILAAALHLAAQDPGTLMLVAPSDHAIPDAAAFRAAVYTGRKAALRGQIVTFGIRPTRAETGYGWLELAEVPGDLCRPLALRRFVEKPKAPQAEAMLAAGCFLWNAGIFLATAGTLVRAFADHASHLLPPVSAALEAAEATADSLHLAAGPWGQADEISVDYAVMERAANLCVVPFAAGWSDLGDWDAIWRESAPDGDGCVTTGDVTAIACVGSLLRSDTQGVELVGIGLKDTVVVAMDDAILVADRSRVQEVKEAVARLKARRAVQAEGFASRDGTWSETAVAGTRFAARCLQVAPGSERLVSEDAPAARWMVMSGRAVVHMAEDVAILTAGASLSLGAGTTARIVNPDPHPLVLVEMQTGGGAAEQPMAARPMRLEEFLIAAE